MLSLLFFGFRFSIVNSVIHNDNISIAGIKPHWCSHLDFERFCFVVGKSRTIWLVKAKMV